jgi:predicted choloylglycine hydrolase
MSLPGRLLPLACAFCAFPLTLHGSEPFRFPEKKHGTGELRYINKIPVLTVSGTPEQIGDAVGALAVKPAPKALDYPRGLMNNFYAGVFWNLVVSQGREMVRNFPADYRTELEAMTKAAGAPPDKLIVGNTLFDIKKIVLCSALMLEGERSQTGGPLLGRNLDYPSLGYINEYSLVTVYRPKGKHAFVSVGFPGLVGCLSGMNDAGLTAAVLEVLAARDGEGRFDPRGIPYALCFRTILEECATIDEAKARLEKLPRTTILNMVVADRKKVGTFEITPKSVVFRPAEKGICSCTNHFCTVLKPEKKVDVAFSYNRFDYLEKVRSLKERQSVEDVRERLHGANLGELTLQTMVFEPATLKLHVSFGKAPASRRPLQTLDLAPLLKP